MSGKLISKMRKCSEIFLLLGEYVRFSQPGVICVSLILRVCQIETVAVLPNISSRPFGEKTVLVSLRKRRHGCLGHGNRAWPFPHRFTRFSRFNVSNSPLRVLSISAFEYPDDPGENAFRAQHLADFARRFAANMLNRQNGSRMSICFIKLKSCSNSFPRLVRSADAATWVGLRSSELTQISCRTLSPEF